MNNTVVFNYVLNWQFNQAYFVTGIILVMPAVFLLRKVVGQYREIEVINKQFAEVGVRDSIKDRFRVFLYIFKLVGMTIIVLFAAFFTIMSVMPEKRTPGGDRKSVETKPSIICPVDKLALKENVFGGNYYANRMAEVCGRTVLTSDKVYQKIKIAKFEGKNNFDVWLTDDGDLIAIELAD